MRMSQPSASQRSSLRSPAITEVRLAKQCCSLSSTLSTLPTMQGGLSQPASNRFNHIHVNIIKLPRSSPAFK